MQENPQINQLPPPPGVIGALRGGFDLVSSHLTLILLPVALDALLWFGPRLSVRELFVSTLSDMRSFYIQQNMPVDQVDKLQSFMTDWYSNFNLLGILRTFPIGVSSLMAGKMPMLTPLGKPSVVEVGSIWTLFGWIFLLLLIGWLAGGLYFRWVSGAVGGDSLPGLGRSFFQTLLFSGLFFILSSILGVPFMSFLGLMALLYPTFFNILAFMVALFATWLIVPIFFAPHGIFLRGQNALYSMYTSLRMARFTLPTSSLFVLAVLLISQGLNFLWAVPADDSWMTVVGLLGHAFVTTALLASSFIYYRDMNAWLQIVFERLKPGTAAPQT